MGILRLFLAYIVVLFHSPEGVLTRYFHPGLAVQCFYVISGFYMQLIIKKYFDPHNSSWKINFYKSRFFRIFPLYYLFLILNIIFIYKLSLPGHLPYFIDNHDFKGSITFILSNLLIFGQSLLRLFAYDIQLKEFLFIGTNGNILETTKNAASFHMMIPSWSIDTELLFYLLTPFLLLKSTITIFAVAILGLIIRLTLGYYGYNLGSWSNGFFPSELTVFLMGSLSCRVYLFFENHCSKILTLKFNSEILFKFLKKYNFVIYHILYFITIAWLINYYTIGCHQISC